MVFLNSFFYFKCSFRISFIQEILTSDLSQTLNSIMVSFMLCAFELSIIIHTQQFKNTKSSASFSA